MASELAENVTSQKDLMNSFSTLMSMTLQKALDAEMNNHLGYKKHSAEGRNKKNSRNGYFTKNIKSDDGQFEIEVPRDRQASFEPQIIKKGQRRLDGFDEKIIALYAKGITIFDYPDSIRKVIYTTNAIESLNSVIRKVIKNKRILPNDTSALKMVYLAIKKALKKWTMPIRDWKPAMNQFQIQYGNRFIDD